MSDWPDAAVDYVQAIADTKLLLSHRYSQWMLSGPALEDGIAGASAAQDELGHVRQLFRLLGAQGRDDDWLEGDRDPGEYDSAAPLDDRSATWTAFVATVGPVERAAWYLIDAIDHEDFSGLATRIGQDEYFHLEFLDGRLETLATDDPGAVEEALEEALPGVLAFIGPASYDEGTDPLVAAGYTDRPVATIREAFREKYAAILGGTPVSLAGLDVDWNGPPPEEWNETRRRIDGGGITEADATALSGVRNREFAMD
ncbi:MAG: Phenylacetic acid catabolic protein [Salinirussus sp.]